MKIWSIRLAFIIASTAICYVVYDGNWFAVLTALIVALLLVGAEFCLHLPSTRGYVAGMIGVSVGLLVSFGVLALFSQPHRGLSIVLVLGFGYLGMMSGYYLSTTLSLTELLKF